jgi:hypothetical protein
MVWNIVGERKGIRDTMEKDLFLVYVEICSAANDMDFGPRPSFGDFYEYVYGLLVEFVHFKAIHHADAIVRDNCSPISAEETEIAAGIDGDALFV